MKTQMLKRWYNKGSDITMGSSWLVLSNIGFDDIEKAQKFLNALSDNNPMAEGLEFRLRPDGNKFYIEYKTYPIMK